MKTAALIEEPRRTRTPAPPPARRLDPSPHTKTGNQSETVNEESRKNFLLRISPSLWKELEAWAQTELRSVNGQIEYLLREAVRKRSTNKTEPPRR